MPAQPPFHPDATMPRLGRVLQVKIVLTALLWAAPMLCSPKALWLWMGFPPQDLMLYVRLLGMAYCALLVGYVFAWHDVQRGLYPAHTVWVGIVSNGGACVLLSMAAAVDRWGAWGALAQATMWGSLLATAGITVGLLVWGPLARSSSFE